MVAMPATSNDTNNDTNDTNDTNKLEGSDVSVDKRIYLAMQRDEGITVSKLVELLKISRSTVLRSIKRLKAGGYVVRVGDNRTGQWAVVKN